MSNFNCPNCGGSLNYKGELTIMQCQYCNSTVAVPQEIRAAATAVAVGEGVKKITPMVKYFIIFMILITVVPTCIGLIASLIGVVVGIGAPILVVILSFIGR